MVEKSFFLPSPGYILIEPLEEKNDGLTVATQERELPKKGIVLAVGEKTVTEYGAPTQTAVKKGDIILHTTIGYEEVEYQLKKYRVVPFRNVLGRYENFDSV